MWSLVTNKQHLSELNRLRQDHAEYVAMLEKHHAKELASMERVISALEARRAPEPMPVAPKANPAEDIIAVLPLTKEELDVIPDKHDRVEAERRLVMWNSTDNTFNGEEIGPGLSVTDLLFSKV